MKLKIHGVDEREKIEKIKRLFEIVGHTSHVGNYPAMALSNDPDDLRYIVKRDGQIQIADWDENSPNFNEEPFRNYRFVSDLSDSDLEKFMIRIADDVKDHKGVLKRIRKEERETVKNLFAPSIDDDDDLDDDLKNPFLPSLD